jgi:hypothetical protein
MGRFYEVIQNEEESLTIFSGLKEPYNCGRTAGIAAAVVL